ncbi:hypothetical protein NWFMUON74_12790 [Nocardia wallacei]|uniref:Uncharacterized protein n=1 Tax=Nocardia wallacei TaxID=480035 RepID=A0A7G1KE45_9NOCA|nr:hypothetical protein NWFMUON74_12790 [Nocardia wallacei]
MSIISFAGMARTLVAVGMVSDDDMFLTMAAAGPRSTFDSSLDSVAFGAPVVGAALEAGAGVVWGARACGGAAAEEDAAFTFGAGEAAAGAAGAAGAAAGAVTGAAAGAGAALLVGAAGVGATSTPTRPELLVSPVDSGV